MNIRTYTDADFQRLKELHEQSGYDYALPPMSTFFSKRVVESKEGIGAAVLMRLNAEVYLICNPEWRTPAWRGEAIRQLHEVCRDDAQEKEVQEAIAFLPPQLERFGKKLVTKFGWSRDRDWPCYSKRVNPNA